MGKKYFIWYDTSYRSEPITKGPHYYADIDLIGKSYYHTLEDLLKMNVSDSIKKRLRGARIGTKIRLHYLHSDADMMLKRVDNDMVKHLEDLTKIDLDVEAQKKELNELERIRNIMINIITT